MADSTSLSDILTVAKNLVSALSNIRDIYAAISGNQTSPEASAATLIFTGQGRLVRVSVTDTGTADGLLYDSNSPTSLGSPIGYVPMAGNVVEFGIQVQRGLVFIPGTSQKAVVVFSKA